MKVAVIGGGISGLSCAYILKQKHNVTVYEKNNYIGGHSRTIEATFKDTKIPVDTGFIVFNYRNYPYLTSLFKSLDVKVEESNMSFSASIAGGKLEYGTDSLSSIFAQKKNLFSPKHYKLIKDVFKFNKQALRYLQAPTSTSLGQALKEIGLSQNFIDYFILPIGGCIWSVPAAQMLEFPAQSFVRFFYNHGLITINDQPQWHTVSGGSRQYVKKLTKGWEEQILTNTTVNKVTREKDKIIVTDNAGNSLKYDKIVFASHGDETYKMIADLDKKEKEVLKNFKFQKNKVYLHSDESLMPKNKGAWASWNYIEEGADKENICLSYWMNKLQNIDNKYPLFVTLNSKRPPAKDKLHNAHEFEHPIFDGNAVAAQQALEQIQGHNNSYYCGAYTKYGFHEDGINSAVNVAKYFALRPQWL